MNKPANIHELFAPLDTRLLHFESKKYLETQVSVGTGAEDINYAEMFVEIHKAASGFERYEVIREAVYYKDRVQKAMESLQPIEKEEYFLDYSFEIEHGLYDEIKDEPGIRRETPPERKIELMERYKKELSTYNEQLDLMIKAREGPTTENKPTN